HGFLLMPLDSEIRRHSLVEPQQRNVGKMRQQVIKPVEVMGFDFSAGEKARHEIAKGHLLVGHYLKNSELPCRSVILELLLDFSSYPLVGSPGGFLTTDAFNVVDRPPNI